MLYLVVSQGQRRFLLDTDHVVEVLPPLECTAISNVHRAIHGVFSYHGVLVPVVDFGLLMNAQPTALQFGTRIVLYRVDDDRMLGLLVEDAAALLRRDAKQFEPAPIDAPYTGGFTSDEGGLLQLLHPGDVLPQEIWTML